MFTIKSKRIITIVLIIVLIFSGFFTTYADDSKDIFQNKLHSKSVALIEGLNGNLLYGKNENIPLAMASTTKIMTCIIALEYGNMNEVIKVSKKAQTQPKVHLGMKAGEEYILKDLLYSLMLESHNDSAVCIAEGVSGSVEEFASLMNKKAKELGLNNTYFITPNGLDETDEIGEHHTTALELAKIMKYCTCDSDKKDEFLEITQTRNYSFSEKNSKRVFNCTNHNLLFDKMDGIISGKTGYTSKAGYCYIGALQMEGRVYIVALLACGWPNNKNYKWEDAKLLLNYGKDNYYYIDINQLYFPDDILDRKKVVFKNENMDEKYVDVNTENTYCKSRYIIVHKDSKASMIYNATESIVTPVKLGEQVGFIEYYIDGELIKKVILTSSKTFDEPDISYFFKKVFNCFIL